MIPPALIGVTIVLALLAVFTGVVTMQRRDAVEVVLNTSSTGSASPTADSTASGEASPVTVVHVTGAVVSPGVYSLEPGARIEDALDAAGGLLPDAAEWAVNRAAPVSDGAQVYVPTRDAAPHTQASDSGPNGGDSLINLNTADESELDELPGIGPALARRIVAYREQNGPFESFEDLLAVSGIGTSKLEGLRDSATF